MNNSFIFYKDVAISVSHLVSIECVENELIFVTESECYHIEVKSADFAQFLIKQLVYKLTHDTFMFMDLEVFIEEKENKYVAS